MLCARRSALFNASVSSKIGDYYTLLPRINQICTAIRVIPPQWVNSAQTNANGVAVTLRSYIQMTEGVLKSTITVVSCTGNTHRRTIAEGEEQQQCCATNATLQRRHEQMKSVLNVRQKVDCAWHSTILRRSPPLCVVQAYLSMNTYE